jgi:hypothetical protein
MSNRITPFVKRMRTNGGTIYTFSSALEDIGLNINEKNNVVKISNFALLNIPDINQPADVVTDYLENKFNIDAISGAWKYNQSGASIKDGRILIAESFQNYALNLESNILDASFYDSTLQKTISERVFWKWLKETGAIRWTLDSSGNWVEETDADGNAGYNSVVKYIGQVSAGNVRSDSFGTYNETYILVPTSHGQMRPYFQQIEDTNYFHGMEIGNKGINILGRENYVNPHPDGLDYRAYYDFSDSSILVGTYSTYYDQNFGVGIPNWQLGWWYTAEGINPVSSNNAYLTDSSNYLTSGIYTDLLEYSGATDIPFRRSRVDCMSLQWDLNTLKTIFNDSALTFDKMAIDYAINDSFNFNAALIYYTIYNSNQDTILATNLLGVLFLDAPSGNSSNIGFDGILLPSLEKIQSGPGGFGTSYSLRLNIKTDNMVDDTAAAIVDQATSDQLYTGDWANAFYQLDKAVNILSQNNGTINYLSSQYGILQSNQTQIYNDLKSLEFTVNDIGRDITGTAGTLALFSDGDDPLIDSSIYMKSGRVGIFNNNPFYDVQINGDVKVMELIIENAIKDTSGNIILGYGSPIQIGSSTNYRGVDVYVGSITPVFSLDTSSHTHIAGDISICGTVQFEGSVNLNGNINLNGTISSPSFDFSKSYIKDTSNGSTMTWINGFLEVSLGSSVNADGAEGAIQIANNAGLLASDEGFLRWNFINHNLAIGKPTSSSTGYRTDVSGNINIDGSIYVRGIALNVTGVSQSYVDTSLLKYATNASVGLALQPYTTNSSIGLAKFLKESSLNLAKFKWNTGLLEPSVAAGGGGSSNISWAAGVVGSNNQILTAIGDGSIYAEATLSYDACTLLFATGQSRYIKMADAVSGNAFNFSVIGASTAGNGVGGSLTFVAGRGGTAANAGGDVSIMGGRSGNTGGNGGSIYIIGGAATSNKSAGNIYLNAGDTSAYVYLGTIKNNQSIVWDGSLVKGTPGIAFKSEPSTGLAWTAAGRINVISQGINKFAFDSSSFYVLGDIIGFATMPSDLKLKTNVISIEGVLDRVLQLRGIEYDKISDNKHHAGYIAQEVEPLFPTVVTSFKDVFSEGEPTYKGINYQELIPYISESIKELKKIIENQEIRIQILESKLK